jgi:hypothetical protein
LGEGGIARAYDLRRFVESRDRPVYV